MSICVIPARGGSKRIPNKNIRDFCGKPIIAWSIEAAQESGCFEQIVVSTDDDRIAEVAAACGATVPFRREQTLSDDHTPTAPVIADAINRLGVEDATAVCCLYATAPLVAPADLRDGLKRLTRTQATFVLTVTTFASPIQRALRRSETGAVEMFDPSRMQTRSQDLEEAWHDAGQFYWARAEIWKSGAGIFDKGAYGLPLPRHRVQDIDTQEDWELAEWIFKSLSLSMKE